MDIELISRPLDSAQGAASPRLEYVMFQRFRPLTVLLVAVLIAGCSGGADEEAKKQADLQAKAAAAKAKLAKEQAEKKKKEQQKPEPPKMFEGKLTSLIPPSITTAIGAHRAGIEELAEKTDVKFLEEMRPALLVLSRGGIQPADVEEIWVGGDRATDNVAMCAKLVQPFHRNQIRGAYNLGEPVSKVDISEIYQFPTPPLDINAIALVDPQIIMIGRRKTLEEALQKMTGGPVETGLTATKAEFSGYWVATSGDHYLQQLAYHGFTGIEVPGEDLPAPIGFGMAFPVTPPKTTPQAGDKAANNAIKKKPVKASGFGRRGDDDEEEEQGLQLGRNVNQRNRLNRNVSAQGKPTVTVLMGLAYANDGEAMRMEKVFGEAFKRMPQRLAESGAFEVVQTNRPPEPNRPSGTNRTSGANTPPTGNKPRIPIGGINRRDLPREEANDLPQWDQVDNTETAGEVKLQRRSRRGDDDEDEDDNRRRGFNPRDRNGANPGRPPVVRRGEIRLRNRRGDDDDDDDRQRGGLRIPPKTGLQQLENQGPVYGVVTVRFSHTIERVGSVLHVKLEMDYPKELVSVAAATQNAAATPLSGDGVFPGGFALLNQGMTTWAGLVGENRRGVKKVEDKPIIIGYSWMTELLPYMGYADVYGQIDFNTSWVESDQNRRAASTVIPQFLNPAAGEAQWRGYPYNGMGLTHFVGMSGVEDGPNVVAAALDRSDPRAGIFGYDSIASPEQITDGAGNTIMMIGSGRLTGPWVQGGGATIRGAREPYFDELSGFGSPGLQTRGTMVLFADGSSREISADIDPEVFRAMCTIHGGETVDIPQGEQLVGGTAMPAPTTTIPSGPIAPKSKEMQNILKFFTGEN